MAKVKCADGSFEDVDQEELEAASEILDKTDNLPNWPGASKAYSNAYKILKNMASKGHAKPGYWFRGIIQHGWSSNEMNDFIKALNEGDEEKVKGFILMYRSQYLDN